MPELPKQLNWPDYDILFVVVLTGRKGELDRALQDFTKALELNPNSSQAYYARGIVHLSLGEWQKAQSDLTAAKSMGLDISASFRRDNNNVAAFEQKIGGHHGNAGRKTEMNFYSTEALPLKKQTGHLP